MKCPDNLTREDVWRLLGEYASDVGDAEGILFSDDPYVNEACDQYCVYKRDTAHTQVKEFKAAHTASIKEYHEARYKEALEESNNP
jgi:hypothetical protein